MFKYIYRRTLIQSKPFHQKNSTEQKINDIELILREYKALVT